MLEATRVSPGPLHGYLACTAVPWSVSMLRSVASLSPVTQSPPFSAWTSKTPDLLYTVAAYLACTAVPWSVSALGSEASLTTQVPQARGSGQYGMALQAVDSQPILLIGPAVTLDEGEFENLHYSGVKCSAT